MQKLKNQISQIERWREAFRDDTTGIYSLVQDLLWNYAAFQTTVQIVNLASQRQDEGVTLNQMLFNLIREGYWSSFLLGARRLLDKGVFNGPKGVYSIRSVLKDVKESRSWLNRKIYVEHLHGAAFDTARLIQEAENAWRAANGPVWGDPARIKSDAAHKCFDELSGITPADRSPDDLMSAAIFDRIEARLAALDKVVVHVDKHVAHSGSKASRENTFLQNFDMHEVRTTLKHLKEVSTLVGVWFANEGSGGLATFLGDQFNGLDQPVIRSADIQILENHWQEMDRDISKWNINPQEL